MKAPGPTMPRSGDFQRSRASTPSSSPVRPDGGLVVQHQVAVGHGLAQIGVQPHVIGVAAVHLGQEHAIGVAPRFLATYMAMSALRTTLSRSAPCSGYMAMPIEQLV